MGKRLSAAFQRRIGVVSFLLTLGSTRLSSLISASSFGNAPLCVARPNLLALIKQVECLCRPDASAPINHCFNRVYDQLVDGKYELTGHGSGWKIKGDGKLYGPGGVKFALVHLRTLWKLRRDLFEAMISDTFNGPTVLQQLDCLRYTVNDAANDDGTGLAGNGTQTSFANF